MSFLNIARILSIAMIVLLSACNKDNMDEIVVDDPIYQPDTTEVNNLIKALQTNTDDGVDLGCITIQFPFDLILESGMTLTVNSNSDFEAAINAEAPNSPVDFVYPLNVTDSEGNLIQVANNVELGTSFASCIPADGWDDTTNNNGTLTIPAFLFEELCFDLVYPVDVEDADDNAYTANDETELIDLLATTPNLSFILPITVLDEEGNEHIIESVAEFYDLYYACDGIIPPGTEGGIVIDLSDLDSTDCDFDALAIQYPYDVVTDAGELITVEDENQEAALILSGEHYTVQYPFNLVDADGTVITINDEMEFIQLILPCLVTIGDPADPCDTDAHILLFFNAHNIFTLFDCPFDINYPVDVVVDGTPVTLNSVDDYFAETGAPNSFGDVDLVYPITVTVVADGSTVELNSDQDVCDFITGCE